MKKKSVWLFTLFCAVATAVFATSQANAGIVGFGTVWSNFRMYSMPAAGGSNLLNNGVPGTRGGYGVISDPSLPANTITNVIIIYNVSVNPGSSPQTVSFRLCRNNFLVMTKPVCTDAAVNRTYSGGTKQVDSVDLGGFTALPSDGNGSVFIDDQYYIDVYLNGSQSIQVYATGIFTGVAK